MRLSLYCFLFLSLLKGFSQETPIKEKLSSNGMKIGVPDDLKKTNKRFSEEKGILIDTMHIKVDSLYREDQFYFGIIYNSLLNKPPDFSQNKISAGFSLGFLRDMPINKSRTVAIAPGIGFAYNNYFQNLAITGTSQSPIYTILPSSDYSKNKFEQFFIEAPIEFRWRTSTPESYKFWRIYSGFKFSYLLFDKSVLVANQLKTKIKNNKDLNTLLYGAYIATGYNTLNLYMYYGLNSLFKSSTKTTNGNPVELHTFSIGVVFYIL